MGGEAGKNEHFLALLYCLVDNDCMPKYPASGVCLAEDSQALDTKGGNNIIESKLERGFSFLTEKRELF